MPENHALLGPSSAKQWLACTPSIRFEQLFPDRKSDAADEGTLAHRLCELKLMQALGKLSKAGYTAAFNTEIRNSEYYNKAMEDYAAEYCVYVMVIYNGMKKKDKNTVIYLERSYSFGAYVREGFGTADVSIFSADKIVVIDFKYGKGVLVEVEDNPQLKLYALGALEEFGDFYDAETVEMHIYQPRIDNIANWSCYKSDIYNWAVMEVKPKADMAFSGLGLFSSGDHCRFCKGAGACKKRMDDYLALGEEYQLAAGNILPVETLSTVLDKISPMTAWIDDIKESALHRHTNGEPIPNYKLVRGRSSREISDFNGATKALAGLEIRVSEMIAPTKLVSFEKLYKLRTKKEIDTALEPFIKKSDGALTLVHKSDKRAEINSTEYMTKFFDDGFTE